MFEWHTEAGASQLSLAELCQFSRGGFEPFKTLELFGLQGMGIEPL